VEAASAASGFVRSFQIATAPTQRLNVEFVIASAFGQRNDVVANHGHSHTPISFALHAQWLPVE
jgi:hypothetical protein